GTAQAAVVTYDITNLNGTPVSPSVVWNTSGTPGHTILGALNLGGGEDRSSDVITVNGVTFELADRVLDGSKEFSSSGLTIAWTSTETNANGSRTGITGRYEGDFFELMTNTLLSNADGISLTLSGLQAQQEYRVQFLIDDLFRGGTNA